MSIELWLLAGSLLLALVQIALASNAAKRQTGIAWSVGPRDQPHPLSGVAARLERARRNLMETLPVFAGAVLLVHVAGRETWASALGAHMFLWARVAYVPIYAAGVPWLRSIVWCIASLGIVLVLASLLL